MRPGIVALTVTLVLGLLIPSLPAPAQRFDWERYKPSSLRKIVEEHAHTYQGRADFTISAQGFPYSVKATYGSGRRPIEPRKQALIRHWVKATQRDPRIVDFFQHEMLFREDSVPYWLPVQQVLVPHFEKELQEGQEITLFVMWIGKAGTDPVIIVNEFQK